jgi:hypothetical protein
LSLLYDDYGFIWEDLTIEYSIAEGWYHLEENSHWTPVGDHPTYPPLSYPFARDSEGILHSMAAGSKSKPPQRVRDKCI